MTYREQWEREPDGDAIVFEGSGKGSIVFMVCVVVMFSACCGGLLYEKRLYNDQKEMEHQRDMACIEANGAPCDARCE